MNAQRRGNKFRGAALTTGRLVDRGRKVREQTRLEGEQLKRLRAIWDGRPPSDDEARRLLESVGACLKSALSLPSVVEDADLHADVVRLCMYFRARELALPGGLWLRLPRLLVVASVPWRASEAIRISEVAPAASPRQERTADLNAFGAFLLERAQVLSSGDSGDMQALKTSGSLPHLEDQRLADSCADEPLYLSESLYRLATLIDNASLSPSWINRFSIGLAVAGAVVLAVFFGSWADLGLRQNLQGVKSVLGPLTAALIASAAICASIREDLTAQLNAYGLARAKTLNKCCAALLGLSTLLLGIGLSTGNLTATPIYAGLLLYAMSIATTISSEHMVNSGEARLKSLT